MTSRVYLERKLETSLRCPNARVQHLPQQLEQVNVVVSSYSCLESIHSVYNFEHLRTVKK